MEEKKLLNQLKGLLEEKYEPILVVQLLRVPPQSELQAFAQKLVNDFGYKSPSVTWLIPRLGWNL